jgi:hypothetical protein
MECAKQEWARWFNHHRLLVVIGYIPRVVEYEEAYFWPSGVMNAGLRDGTHIMSSPKT